MTRVVIIGGGPGGYEAALVGSQLGGDVTLIDTDGLGGSAVLTDCVPSKTLIATAEVMTEVHGSAELGLRFGDADRPEAEAGVHVDLAAVNRRVLALAQQQSADICDRVLRENVDLVIGRGRLDGPDRVLAETADGERRFDAEMILVATGATPRELPEAKPDGERILTWTQVYGLSRLPERLIVVGSGVTGRRVRQRVRRARVRGRARLLARSGAARRGRRRGAGAGGRVRPPRADRAVPFAGAVGHPGRRRGDRHLDRRANRHRLALPAGRRFGAQHP